MSSRLPILIDLLHALSNAGLSTLSTAMPGYPFATVVPFATDEHHRPVLLVSKLAEHTRNLAADSRASLVVAKPLGEGEVARVSLVGEVLPIDADSRLTNRYLRFHPEAERFLQLGDFRFHRFEPKRILVVGGFAQAGWLDGQQLLDAPFLSLGEEAELLAAANPKTPEGLALLGLDAYGVDLMSGGTRRRITFGTGPLVGGALLATLARELAA